jgi:hypothetical protein
MAASRVEPLPPSNASETESMVGGRRAVLLHEAAVAAARAWTSSWFRTLADDGRRIEGGWPGTLPEARGRVSVDAARALAGSSMTALTREELKRLTRTTYEEARRLWRALAIPG